VNLPWQQTSWQQLLAGARQNRLPHAWLLAGPAGIGKHHFAQRLAGLLLCEDKTARDATCGVCPGCHLLAAGHHPDLIRLTPEEDKSQIAVETLRESMQRLALSSHRGGRRILLIDPADALNDSGVNSLLKTLEEPPAGAHLILLTERLMALKSTLRSRCQILRLPVPTVEQGKRWLQEQAPALPAQIAQHFARRPTQALRQTESPHWDPDRWAELFDGLAAAFGRIESLHKNKQQLLPCLCWLIREATLSLGAQLRGANDARPLLQKLGAQATSDWLLEAAQTHRALAGQTAANPRMLLESLMIGLYEKVSTKP